MTEGPMLLPNVTAVAIEGRALAIEGPPGSGKSSLALALIDRGAELVGDDGISVEVADGAIFASPPPNITGLLEIRGIGLVELPTAPPCPLALILTLGAVGARLPEMTETLEILGIPVPVLPFEPGPVATAPRAEWALRRFGLRI